MRGHTDRAALARAGLVLCVFLVLGVVGTFVWHAWWQAPTGVVYKDQWYLSPPGPDVGFSGTALYVVVALVCGLVAGVGLALLRGHETLTLLVSLVAAVLAGWLMYAVGHALGPQDPRPLAHGREDLSKLPGDLALAAPDDSREPWRSSALAAMPAGALVGLCALYLLGTHREEDFVRDGADPARPDPARSLG